MGVRDLVPTDRHEPRRELRAVGVEALPSAPRSDEHRLGDVLGVAPVAERPHRHRVHEGGPALVRLAQRALVTAGEGRAERPEGVVVSARGDGHVLSSARGRWCGRQDGHGAGTAVTITLST